MNKEDIILLVRDYLQQQEEVVFAYLFGSFTDGDTFRDIDIAIYTNKKPDLISLGLMKVELDRIVGHEVDLVLLNSLPDKNPAFANEIISRGQLLFSKNPEAHTDYKRKTLLYYIDTAWLRDQVDNALEKRLESGKFGLRDYV